MIRDRRWKPKAPDVSRMLCGAVRLDFIDSPVIRGARNKTVRQGMSGKSDNEMQGGLVTLKRLTRTVADVVKVRAEVHIMRSRRITWEPAKAHPSVLKKSAVGRCGIICFMTGHQSFDLA